MKKIERKSFKEVELPSVEVSIPTPRCMYCVHFFKDVSGFRCEAYPGEEGIPQEILAGKPHDRVFDDQEGDYVFEPVEGWTEEDWRTGKI